jgi:hypothetical protein
MVKEKIENKYLKEILVEMCSRVGATYENINFKEHNWYGKYEWPREEEDSFKEWLYNYFKKNKEARKSLTNIFSPSKKALEKCVDMFTLNYGWKTKLD